MEAPGALVDTHAQNYGREAYRQDEICVCVCVCHTAFVCGMYASLSERFRMLEVANLASSDDFVSLSSFSGRMKTEGRFTCCNYLMNHSNLSTLTR